MIGRTAWTTWTGSTAAIVLAAVAGLCRADSAATQPRPSGRETAAALSGEMIPGELQVGESIVPTGSRPSLLAFSALVDENWDIFTWDFDPKHEPVQVTKTAYDESAPSLAYDHSFCVYESVDGKLWKAALGSSEPPECLPFGTDEKFDMHPAVSPDGRSIVMAASLNRRTDDSDLIVYDYEAEVFGRRLELMSYQHYPAWAPDGKHLAFSNLHGRLQTGKPICEIWVMRADAPWARQLTLLDSLSISPAWSPRGDLIAFACNRGEAFKLWLVDPTNRKFAQLTDGPSADTDPVFSPDGRSIIFVSTRGGEGRTGLFRIELDSRKVTPVKPFGKTDPPCKDPDWK